MTDPLDPDDPFPPLRLPGVGSFAPPLAALKGMQEAVESLRKQLDLSRSERAHWIEKSQAQDEEIQRLRDRLLMAESAQKAVDARVREREADLAGQLDQAIERERLLRTKFEDELRRLTRLRAASEAEGRETLSLKEKELATSFMVQQESSTGWRQERRRLEELVTGYQSEIGRLRAVLQAVDQKLQLGSARDAGRESERRSLELLVERLLEQNNALQGRIGSAIEARERAESALAAAVDATLEKASIYSKVLDDKLTAERARGVVLERRLEEQRRSFEAQLAEARHALEASRAAHEEDRKAHEAERRSHEAERESHSAERRAREAELASLEAAARAAGSDAQRAELDAARASLEADRRAFLQAQQAAEAEKRTLEERISELERRLEDQRADSDQENAAERAALEELARDLEARARAEAESRRAAKPRSFFDRLFGG